MAEQATFMTRLRAAARQLKRNIAALYFAYRDPRTPWYAKGLAILIVVYALSPIDLIPDFIPILGYVDDLLLVPLGIWIALRMIPPQVMADARRQAAEHPRIEGTWGRWGLAMIIGIYVLIALAVGVWIWRRWLQSR